MILVEQGRGEEFCGEAANSTHLQYEIESPWQRRGKSLNCWGSAVSNAHPQQRRAYNGVFVKLYDKHKLESP